MRLMWNSLRAFVRNAAAFIRRVLKDLDYLTEPERAEALKRLLREIRKVLVAVLPKRGDGYIRLGLSDPFETGRIMQLFAMFYPCYGKHIEVIPEFSEPVLETKLSVRGRIYLFTLVKTALILFMDKNLRQIYRHYAGE